MAIVGNKAHLSYRPTIRNIGSLVTGPNSSFYQAPAGVTSGQNSVCVKSSGVPHSLCRVREGGGRVGGQSPISCEKKQGLNAQSLAMAASQGGECKRRGAPEAQSSIPTQFPAHEG